MLNGCDVAQWSSLCSRCSMVAVTKCCHKMFLRCCANFVTKTNTLLECLGLQRGTRTTLSCLRSWGFFEKKVNRKKHEPKKPNKIYAVGSNEKLFGAPNEKQNGESGRSIVEDWFELFVKNFEIDNAEWCIWFGTKLGCILLWAWWSDWRECLCRSVERQYDVFLHVRICRRWIFQDLSNRIWCNMKSVFVEVEIAISVGH